MNQTIDWINKVTNELVDPEARLKDTLLKVQVLAFKIKNDKLKDWVEKELNGYAGFIVPEYRKIPAVVFGNLMQDRGFGSTITRRNQPLPIEYIDQAFHERLIFVAMNLPVSELEHMMDKNGDYQINIPHAIHSLITNVLSNGWIVDSAWQKISLSSVEGIISAIKSNLLKFLLELAEEIGEKENINIMEHKKKIDNLFDKTIGNLTGETINISIGTDNVQSINTGTNAKVNVAKGINVEQSIKIEASQDLVAFITELKTQIEKLGLSNDDKEDITNEISRIETQLVRNEPKYPIINGALTIMNGILMGVAGNALTPPILEKINLLIEHFK